MKYTFLHKHTYGRKQYKYKHMSKYFPKNVHTLMVYKKQVSKAFDSILILFSFGETIQSIWNSQFCVPLYCMWAYTLYQMFHHRIE